MFTLHALSFKIKDRRIFGPLDATLASSGRLVIQGVSGSGKSTLLRILAGLCHPSAGELRCHNEVIEGGKLLEHRRHFRFIDQQPTLLGDSLKEVLNLGLELHELPAKSDDELSASLKELSLEELRLEADPHMLSGGERMRVALLRGLLPPAECLLLDEPTTGLDDGSVRALLGFLDNRKGLPPILSASHDPRWIESCDTRYSLEGGQLHAL